jgi:uncharacterized coiled-coil protein SlyX
MKRRSAIAAAAALTLLAAVDGRADTAFDERLRKLEEHAAYQRQAVEQLSSWVGILLHRTDDMQKRETQEALARLIAPEFSPLELKLLNRWEISTDPLPTQVRAIDWNRVGTPTMQTPKARAGKDFHNYTAWGYERDQVTGQRLTVPAATAPINPALPPLSISISGADTAYPVISVSQSWRHSWFGPQLEDVYYEFDTDPSFESPAMWRYPALMPTSAMIDGGGADSQDLTTVRGLTYHLFTTTQRDYRPTRELRFPFRVSAMARPNGVERGSFEEMAAVSLQLQHGLDRDQRIREVFQYGRLNYVWGSNTIIASPLDTFRARVAECGGINDLMGAMLEMTGVRYRAVGGFHPINRVWFPGGGHTAIEVHDGERWSFLDSYLDFLTPGVAARDFLRDAIGFETLPAPLHVPPDYLPAMAAAGVAGNLRMRDLFKYRSYGDTQLRAGGAYMMQLRLAEHQRSGAITEETYGLHWQLRPAPPPLDVSTMPESTTVYVRARYAQSRCRVSHYHRAEKCTDASAVLSPWATAQFTFNPRKLLQDASLAMARR